MADRALIDSRVNEPRVAEWQRRAEWPLTALAVVFLVAYAWTVLDTDLSARTRWWLEALLWVTWGLFVVDYLARLSLARRRWRFVWRHLLDFVIIVLPMFRQLRVLRLVIVLTSLHRQVRTSFHGRISIYVGGATALVGFAASLAVYDAERRHPDASITTFGEAVWWTITTISTVGYGDRYPVTWQGRLVAASLMVAGIALLGTVTAAIASWFVEKINTIEDAMEDAEQRTQVDLDEVMSELRRLHQRLDELQSPSEATTR
jgi:voltage-gated potassium channel